MQSGCGSHVRPLPALLLVLLLLMLFEGDSDDTLANWCSSCAASVTDKLRRRGARPARSKMAAAGGATAARAPTLSPSPSP